MIKRQAGFSTVEAIIIGLILLALVGVGFWVAKERRQENPGLSTAESVDAPSAPVVNTVSDLQSLEAAIDEVNLEAVTSDNADLDAQASGF